MAIVCTCTLFSLNHVIWSADMTLTREDVASGGDNVRECSLEIPVEKTETVSEEGQATTVVVVV